MAMKFVSVTIFWGEDDGIRLFREWRLVKLILKVLEQRNLYIAA